jgi:drug/metabolite transporter (DMT)-like permease
MTTHAPAMNADVSMRPQDVAALLGSAAMWGASFIFMRLLAPVMGWVWAADLRVLIGGMLVAVIMLITREPLHLKRDWPHFLLLGLINSAIPFALFAVAALHVPAAYSAIGNATAPLWSALVGFLLFKDRLSKRKLFGLCLGVFGVVLTARAGTVSLSVPMLLAFGGTLLAALLYAFAGAYMKTKAKHISPMALGCGGQFAAALWLLPLMYFHQPAWELVDLRIALLMLGSGIISTGLPYVLYFPLMRRIGVTKAMTVTFLVPCFAFAFGYLFLNEALTLGAVTGCALVVGGLFLALRERTAVK